MKRFLVVFLLGLVPVCLAQPNKQNAVPSLGTSMILDYYKLQLQLIKATGIQPTEAARIFGYTGLALYEAVVPGEPTARSLVGQLNGFDYVPKGQSGQQYLGEVLAFAAMRRTLHDMILRNKGYQKMAYFGGMVKEPIEKLLSQYESPIRAKYGSHKAFGASMALSDTIAATVCKYSLADGGHREETSDFGNDYRHYESPAGATWQDSLTLMKFSLQPTWGKNRTFLKGIHAIAQAPNPIPYSTQPNSRFYQQALEVYDNCRDQEFEKRLIAEYWKDAPSTSFTPPGHMICLATQLLKETQASFDFAVLCYAKLGLALNDAFVCCWKTKYETNCIRPETYIIQNIDPQFKPPIATPHFPEYTSGHSVQAGAAVEVLSELFGENYHFTDRTPEMLGSEKSMRLLKPRHFNSFREMAREASMSRLYGGIHFRQACEVGVWQGETIGKQVNTLAWKN